MSRPRVYTVVTSISMRGVHRAEIESHLADDVGLGSALRDAGLRVIGRDDLVIDGRDESGRRRNNKAVYRPWVFVRVALTTEQHQALIAAAKSREMSLSALLHDALRFELRLAPPNESASGWKRGKRRSKPPKA